MTVLAIIPARGGSKGMPKKNIADLVGKPVIAHVIDAARSARSLDRIVVSTDDPDIAAVGRSCGIDVVDRPPEFATDAAPIDPALRHAVRASEAAAGVTYDEVVWLQANVPTTRGQMIDEAVARLQQTGAHSVATVLPFRKPPQWGWRIEGDKLFRMENLHQYTVLRQQTVPVYHYDGSVIAMRRDILMNSEGVEGQAYMGTDRRCIVLDHFDSVEIDEPFDMLVAEVILRTRLKELAK
jgi:CMP-N,N'-diacetyllegionaminic acid synthase